eukprot:scaffold226373_cov21-Prasinocladus_malaysianus.AAC.1
MLGSSTFISAGSLIVCSAEHMVLCHKVRKVQFTHPFDQPRSFPKRSVGYTICIECVRLIQTICGLPMQVVNRQTATTKSMAFKALLALLVVSLIIMEI